MNLHVCLLDRDCREYDAPPRLYINDVFGWSAIIALGPRGKSQEWTPKAGYTRRWRWVTIGPPGARTCVRNGGPRGCGRLAGHDGPHAEPAFGPGPGRSK